MRPRAALLVPLLAAFLSFAGPAMAVAAPHRNHGLTIAATPNPVISGDAVLIYGQLEGTNVGNQTIVLYHRIDPNRFFTVVGTTKTTSTGFYDFPRTEGVVLDNRSWFVRAPGLPGDVHSRTVHESVAAEVSVNAPATALTNQPVDFTGLVAPNDAGRRILLQEQVGATGSSWKTIATGTLDSASQFSIPVRFKEANVYTLRAFFLGDHRNIAAPSDSVTVTVNQKEIPDFTIAATPAAISDGSAITITGTLSNSGTTTPDPNTMVTLWGRTNGQPYAAISSTTTAANGSYTFTESPQNNTVYQVRTSFAPIRTSAQAFVGVRSLVSIAPTSMTSSVGQSVTFTGAVAPDKAGHLIELQRLGADGRYHVVDIGFVNSSSVYRFVWTFGTPGAKTFRVYVPGGPDNAGGYSSAETITVSLPSVQALPIPPAP